MGLDAVEHVLGGLVEEVQRAVRRVRQRLALRRVGAGRPHEVAAGRVDVVRELDVLERVLDPDLVPGLGLGELEQAGGVAAGAARARRALEAVEDRADGEVAVDVDAVAVAVGRVAEVLGARRVRSSRGPCWCGAASRRSSGHAVAVDLREDEDVQVVDERRGLGVGAVVAHEALRGLEADARGRDLAARAPGSTGRRRPSSRRATLPMRSIVLVLRAARDRRRGAQQVAERRGDARLDDAVAGGGAVLASRGRRARVRVGVDRGDRPRSAVLVTAPSASVAG